MSDVANNEDQSERSDEKMKICDDDWLHLLCYIDVH